MRSKPIIFTSDHWNYVNDVPFLTALCCSVPSLCFSFLPSCSPIFSTSLTTLHWRSPVLFSILTPSCPSSPLMRSCCLASKGSTRKDPSARLVFSRGCIQRVALFCSARYHIYPTPDSLCCRSQDLFSNLMWSCMELLFYTLLDTNHHVINMFFSKLFTIYLLLARGRSLWIQAMFAILYVIICLGVYSNGFAVYVCMFCSGGWKGCRENLQQIERKDNNLPAVSCGFLSSSWRQRYGTFSLCTGPKQSLIHSQITTSGHA